jgi:glycosyltransferase involved in cell wall biosynthesis
MSEPSISVTVPSYNRSARLAELLAATVAQLHDGDELIVVDDGSRDDWCSRRVALSAAE